MELERAREIANVSRAIIESGKLEVKFLEVTGAISSTDFLPPGEHENQLPRATPKLVNR